MYPRCEIWGKHEVEWNLWYTWFASIFYYPLLHLLHLNLSIRTACQKERFCLKQVIPWYRWSFRQVRIVEPVLKIICIQIQHPFIRSTFSHFNGGFEGGLTVLPTKCEISLCRVTYPECCMCTLCTHHHISCKSWSMYQVTMCQHSLQCSSWRGIQLSARGVSEYFMALEILRYRKGPASFSVFLRNNIII